MTSYLMLYATQWATLYEQAKRNDRRSFWSLFGLLPHEIAARNAR